MGGGRGLVVPESLRSCQQLAVLRLQTAQLLIVGRGGGKVTALVDSEIARTRLLGFPFYVVLGNPFLYSLHCDTII